jgi:hypothetical protein
VLFTANASSALISLTSALINPARHKARDLPTRHIVVARGRFLALVNQVLTIVHVVPYLIPGLHRNAAHPDFAKKKEREKEKEERGLCVEHQKGGKQ